MENLSLKQKEQQERYMMDMVSLIPTIKEVFDWKQEKSFEDMVKKYREPIQFITLNMSQANK